MRNQTVLVPTVDQAAAFVVDALNHGTVIDLVVSAAVYLWSKQCFEKVASGLPDYKSRRDVDRCFVQNEHNQARFVSCNQGAKLFGLLGDASTFVVITEAMSAETLAGFVNHSAAPPLAEKV